MGSSAAGGPATGETGRNAAGRQGAAVALAELLADLARDLPGLLGDRVYLLGLELRRAGRACAIMVVMMAIAALMALTAWVALWVLFAFAALALGMPWSAVILLILLLNSAGAGLAVWRARRLVEYLTLPATLRRLSLTPAFGAVAPESPTPSSVTR